MTDEFVDGPEIIAGGVDLILNSNQLYMLNDSIEGHALNAFRAGVRGHHGINRWVPNYIGAIGMNVGWEITLSFPQSAQALPERELRQWAEQAESAVQGYLANHQSSMKFRVTWKWRKK